MRWIGGLALVAAIVSPANAQSADDVLLRAAARYTSAETITARFVQIIANPMLRGTDTTSGTLSIARPNRFALRFVDPAGDRVVIDGEWLWIYLPSGAPGQVLRRSPPQAGLTSANLFEQFLDRPLERYRTALREPETLGGTTHEVIHLVPLEVTIPFREAEFAVGPDGIIGRMDLVERSGQRRRIYFTDVELDRPVDELEFRFSLPDGVRVISQR